MASCKKLSGTVQGQDDAALRLGARGFWGQRTRLGTNTDDTTGVIAHGHAPPTRKTGCGWNDAKMTSLHPLFLAEIAITRGTPSLCDEA
jgi:hypothetical protein